jgi:endonuclease YncB( thermonuclease family)
MMRALSWLVGLSICVVAPAAAETLRGTVVGVSDGDTLTLLTTDQRQVRIRLAEIDAPEIHGQPYGQAAKAALSRLAYRGPASADIASIDQYGRSVAIVEVAGVNVNAAMVRQGFAWAYLRYQTDPAYSCLEADARYRKLGLWSDEGTPSVPPWQFRRGTGHVAVR